MDSTPAEAFASIRRIGGGRGWYYANWLWRLRGLADLLVGGVGLRRGRRDPDEVHVGDALDFWRVEAYEPEHRLLLRAEMKVPGRAWLQFQVDRDPGGGTRIYQTAVFDPLGLWGRLYWYLSYPIHQIMFAGMLRSITRRTGRPRGGPALRTLRRSEGPQPLSSQARSCDFSSTDSGVADSR